MLVVCVRVRAVVVVATAAAAAAVVSKGLLLCPARLQNGWKLTKNPSSHPQRRQSVATLRRGRPEPIIDGDGSAVLPLSLPDSPPTLPPPPPNRCCVLCKKKKNPNSSVSRSSPVNPFVTTQQLFAACETSPKRSPRVRCNNNDILNYHAVIR